VTSLAHRRCAEGSRAFDQANRDVSTQNPQLVAFRSTGRRAKLDEQPAHAVAAPREVVPGIAALSLLVKDSRLGTGRPDPAAHPVSMPRVFGSANLAISWPASTCCPLRTVGVTLSAT
jgi:hypothetical protein